jgi:hypothetical protein
MPRCHHAGRASIPGVALVLALLFSLLSALPAQAAGGTLSGTLTGPDGNPFDYFQVDVYEANGSGGWVHAIPPRTVTSWDTGLPVGDFSIALPAGTYRACFKALTYESLESAGTTCWNGGYEVFGATDFVITEGGTTVIQPQLPLEARVDGRITGPGGVGVSAYVAPYRRAPDGTWQMVFGSQSLPDGSYTITDVDPGTYRFCLLDVPREFLPECWDDAPTVATATELSVQPDGAPILSFSLLRRANISGTVTPPVGSTASISIIAYSHRDGGWQLAAYSSVAPDGTYRVTGLDAGTYRVCANGYDIVSACWSQGSNPADATDIPLTTTQSRSGIDIAPGQAGFVTGNLPDVYLGAQGYPTVTAWRQVVGGWQAVASGESVPTGINSDWTYQIGSLPSGTYVACVEHSEPEFVTAFPRTCNGGSPTPEGAVPFEVVTGATASGIDIVTGQAGEIRGQALGAWGVRVDLYAPTGRLARSQTIVPNGSYRFVELPPGDYKVAFHRATAATSLAAEWWNDNGDGAGLTGATPITVAPAAIVTGIRATLDPGGIIAGRLLDASGDPMAGCLLRARGRQRQLAVRTATTDASGNFAIGGLSTASYLVVVKRACSGAPTRIYYDAGSVDGTTGRLRKADDVAVTRGLTSTLAEDLHTDG